LNLPRSLSRAQKCFVELFPRAHDEGTPQHPLPEADGREHSLGELVRVLASAQLHEFGFGSGFFGSSGKGRQIAGLCGQNDGTEQYCFDLS
jgi:hypothetical protein